MNSWNGTVVFPAAFHNTSVVAFSFVMFAFPSHIWTQTPINTHWVTKEMALPGNVLTIAHFSYTLHTLTPPHAYFCWLFDHNIIVSNEVVLSHIIVVTSNMICVCRLTWVTVNGDFTPLPNKWYFCRCYLAWTLGLYPLLSVF